MNNSVTFSLIVFHQPVVPKKPKRSVPVSSSVDRDQALRESSRFPPVSPLSREASDVMPTPAVRKTDVRTETQPNGSEVTTTIVEFTDQVKNPAAMLPCLHTVLGRSHVMLGICLFQDQGISGLGDVSYSTRQSVSPVSTNTRTSPILIEPGPALQGSSLLSKARHGFVNMRMSGRPDQQTEYWWRRTWW